MSSANPTTITEIKYIYAIYPVKCSKEFANIAENPMINNVPGIQEYFLKK